MAGTLLIPKMTRAWRVARAAQGHVELFRGGKKRRLTLFGTAVEV